MTIPYAKLRGRIVEKYGNNAAFCRALGKSKVSVSKKLTGKTGFSQNDIIKWCELLDIDLDDVGSFFYL